MPDIRELRDNDGNVIFPITHIDAVFDSEGKSIVEQLGDINIEAIKEIDVLNELDNRVSLLGIKFYLGQFLYHNDRDFWGLLSRFLSYKNIKKCSFG